MDAKQLEQISQLKARQSQERGENSNKHCDQGFACLAKALESSSLKEQKPFLIEACEAFTEAIRQQRANPESYIGFAYVLVAIGNYPKALNYVKEAQRLKPSHPDVQPLLDLLKKKMPAKPAPSPKPTLPSRPLPGRPAPPSASAPPSPQPPAPPERPPLPIVKKIDYDGMYDLTELEIVAEVKMLMTGLSVNTVPSNDPKHASQLAKEIKRLHEKKSYFDEQLKIIDQEIDIAELTLKLKPFEQALKRFEKVLEITRALVALCAEMEEQEQLAQQILKEAKHSTDPEDIPVVSENIEVLLDQSDLFADRLDNIETQGFPVEGSVKIYNHLAKSIEDLQDALEDLKDQLGVN